MTYLLDANVCIHCLRKKGNALVKQRVTGGGRAEKLQVAAMVSLLLGLKEHPFEDAADALAVAIAAALDGPVHLPALQLKKKQTATKAKGRDALAALARAQGKL